MNKLWMLVLMVMTISSYAQIEVGYLTDSEAKPIEGYFDLYEYANEKSIKYHILSNEYERGHYYDNAGSRIDGYIKHKSRFIFFKSTLAQTTADKITPELAQSFILAKDSFFVSENLAYGWLNAPIGEKKVFLQHFAAFDGTEYAIHYRFNSGAITPTYLHRSVGSEKWINAPAKSSIGLANLGFQKTLKNYLKHNYINSMLYQTSPESKEFELSDIPTFIKSAEYESKFRKQETLYYDSWWNEVKNSDNYTYTGKIVSVEDRFTIQYFQDGRLINESQYASISPNIRNGYSKSYFENGVLRKEAHYKDGDLVDLSTYFDNGGIHYFIEIYNKKSYIFRQVMAYDGKTCLDDKGNGKEVLYDAFNDRTVYRKFVFHTLDESYFEEGGRKIYQLTDQDFSVNKISKAWNWGHSAKKFYNTLQQNANGYSLTLIKVGSDKQVSGDYQVLTNIHAEIDTAYHEFLEEKLSAGVPYPIKFQSMKNSDKEKVSYEFVLPFNFTIQRLFREPARYYYYDHFWQQQMMQNQIQNIPIPTPPRF